MDETRSGSTGSQTWRAWTALVAVYVLWGSTYLGIRVAVETIPPFTMAGVRYLTAGALVYPFARGRRTRSQAPTSRHWRSAAVVAVLMLVGGNGVLSWAEQTVPSGTAALLVASVPLWLVLLDRLLNGVAIGARTAVAVAVGFAGVALLARPSGVGRFDVVAAAAIVVASALWAAGSLYARTGDLPSSHLLAAAMEMIVGGGVLLVLGGFVGEWARLDHTAVSLRSLAGLLWLVTGGSIVGFTAYVYAVKSLPTSTVSTYAYVNPVVAVALGWLVLGEAITAGMAVGGSLVVLSVIIAVRRRAPAATRGPADLRAAVDRSARSSSGEGQ